MLFYHLTFIFSYSLRTTKCNKCISSLGGKSPTKQFYLYSCNKRQWYYWSSHTCRMHDPINKPFSKRSYIHGNINVLFSIYVISRDHRPPLEDLIMSYFAEKIKTNTRIQEQVLVSQWLALWPSHCSFIAIMPAYYWLKL